MKNKEFAMHINAGTFYGEAATCGTKMDRRTEQSAKYQASLESARLGKKMEAYPCPWCEGWHIGREMTEAERHRFHPDTMTYEVPLL